MALAFLSPTGDTSPQPSVSSLLETPENPGEADSAEAYDFSREAMSPAPTVLLDGVPSPGSAPGEDRFTMDLSRLEKEPQPMQAFSLAENEWSVQNRDLEERMRQWRIDADDVVESAVTDPGFFKDEEFRYATDPASGRMLATNDLFLRAKTDGAPVPVSGLQRDLLRLRVGAAFFPGKDVSTEEALGQRISEYVNQKKDRRDLFNSLGDEVMKAETFGSAGEKAPTFESWLEHAVTLPGYERGNDADYYEAWIQNQQAAREHIAPYRNELSQVWQAMKKGGAGSTSEILKEMLPFASVIGDDLVDELQKKDAGALAYEFYDKLDPDARAGFLDGLHLVVKTFPKEEQADILANLAKSGGRMVDDIGQGIMSRFTLKGLEEEMNRKGSNSMGWWGLSEADKKLAAENADRIKADRLAQRNFRDAVLRMERDEYAPIRYHSKQSTDFFSMRTLEDGLYAVPSTGAFLGTAAIPYAGPVLSYLAMEDFAYKDLRDNSMKAGRPELESSLFAEDWKSVAAIPQTIVERLQVLAPLGRLPMVNKALGAIGSRFTNRYLGGTAKVLAMNAVETGTEEAQYLMTYAVQDLAHAFAGDTRTAPAEWYNGRDGAFDGFWSRQGTTFVSMLPFAALTGGHGGNTEARDQALAGASSVQRRAFGITGEDSAAIDAAVDQESRAEAIRAALANRDPGSVEARAATEELEKLLADQQEALRQAQDAGLLPRIVATADGMHAVLDGGTGRKIGTAKDLAGATRIADAHVAAAEEKEADRVAGIAEPLVTGSETSFSMSQEQEDRAYELKRELGRAITRTRSEVDAMPEDQIGKLGAFWLKLDELSGISRFPKHLPGKSVGEIIENFGDPNITVGKDDKNGEFSFAEIHSPTGIAYVFEDANGVWVNTAGANGEDAYLDPTQTKKGSVGAPAYQIAQAYARNIGKKFVDDEMGGVSEVARFRRWPQMLSSAIRYGSTSHLDATKDVSRWTDGKDPAFDAGLLAMHEAVLVEKYIPEIKNFRLSEDMSKIVDANGAEVSRKAIDDLVTRARDAGALGIGETTLRRAVVTRSAAAEASEILRGQVSGRSGSEFGVFQRAVEDLVSNSGSGGSGLDRGNPLRQIAYAEGRSPGPLVANLPRAVRNSGGGWTLHDRATGREIGRAATTGEAIRLASEHAGIDQKDAASMAFLETMFQGADLSGQLHDTLGLAAGTEVDISTALESDAATRASAEHKARVEAQERMRGGDGSFARLIFGSSTTEIIGNARRVINRILGGGSILTVFHEEGHSLRKAARAAGILTREDDIRMLRAADRILAGKTDRRGGGRLSFLPENFDSLSEAEQDVAIDEGISELLEAEILRTRKGGGTRQLPPGLVSRNLSAFSQLAGDRTAGRYRAFIGAFRQFFGLQMSRAMEIQRALENGTLDRTAYEGYLRKLYNGGTEGKAHVATPSKESSGSKGGNHAGQSSQEKDSRRDIVRRFRADLISGRHDQEELGRRAKGDPELQGYLKNHEDQLRQAEETAFEKARSTRTVNTDEVRPFLPGYAEADPLTRDNDYHQAASAMNDHVLARMLAETPKKGVVTVLAGGGGSGKSTASAAFVPESDFTFDTTLSSPYWAEKLQEQIHGSGRTMDVIYVHRRFPLAVDNMVRRYLKDVKEGGVGRIVPLSVAISAHIGAQETILGLKGSNIKIVDNNGDFGDFHQITLEDLAKDRYINTHEQDSRGTGSGGTTARRGGHPEPERGGGPRQTDNGQDHRRTGSEARLEDEGRRVIEDYRQRGRLTDAAADAFLGVGGDFPKPDVSLGSNSKHATDIDSGERSGEDSLSAGNAPDQPHNQQHDKESRMVSGAGKSQEIPGGAEEEIRRRIRETLAGRDRENRGQRLGDGAESHVFRFGEDQVLKEIKPEGVVSYDADGDPHTEYKFEAVKEKAVVIEAMGGMPTIALEADGKIVLIQDRGTPITETEYLSIELPFGIEPTRRGIYKVEINGNTYLISDLKPENFVKDSQGNIRLIDLITGKVNRGVGFP